MNDYPVITALDFDDIDQAKKTIDRLGDAVDFYKVGNVLFTRCGNDLLKYLKSKNKKIFLDLKYHDIPNTVKGACYQAALHQVDLLTVHLTGGKEMLKAAVTGVKRAKEEHPDKRIETRILGVSVLTSISREVLGGELKVRLDLPAYIDHLIEMGIQSGIDGIVCSAMETKNVREKFGSKLLIVNPGIRLKEDASSDQKRVATPGQAIKDGASYLVIGRPITEASDPVEKVKRIRADIDEA